MKKQLRNSIILLAASVVLVSCNKEKDGDNNNDNVIDNSYTVPTTYVFERNGATSVSYSGQTQRLAMLQEMVDYMKGQISAEASIDAQKLKDMYSHQEGEYNFIDASLNSSTKQLKSKSGPSGNESTFIEAWIDSLANASQNYVTAEAGVSGKMLAGDGSKYLMTKNGVEPVQIIEKGLMGAVFYYQAVSYYFENIASDDNTNIASGKNYTDMEHHFDEAFGYFGVGIDFPTTVPSAFWGKYCNSQDAAHNTNSIIMDNFLKGRAAIVNNDAAARDAAIKEVRETWEEVSARQAVKYLSDYKSKISGDPGKAHHALSEAYAFIYTLKFSPISTGRLSATVVNDWLLDAFGANYNFNDLDLTKINTLISNIENAYSF